MRNIVKWLARLFTVAVTALAAAAWAIPSDVVRMISKEEFVLLGRYSIDHFTAALVLTLVAAVCAYLVFGPRATRRQRRLAVTAWVIVVLVAVFAADLVLRVVFDDAAYVHVGELRLRPPNMDIELVYEDRPLPHRSLPRLEPGYPDTAVRMHTDARGFRNPAALQRTDVLLLGDSFTEGSRVGDDAIWPTLLAAAIGRTVYNIANSGDDPQKYLAKYLRYGRPLRPDTVVVTIYEGNDFRRAAPLKHSVDDYSIGERIGNYLKFAPIRVRYERLLRDLLGPINAGAALDDDDVLAWLPFGYPAGEPTQWYFVRPKRIARLLSGAEEFAASTGWHTARDGIEAIAAAVAADGARLVVTYAPTKARVMLPLVLDALDPGPLLDYLALLDERQPEVLDDPAARARIKELIAEREGQVEAVVAAHFAERGIAFVSLTEPLRAAARAGRQTYFSYDQHWTPDGHRVVVEELAPVVGG